eukprot:GHRR01027289.1.p1 GENE.GHRR01027289.1~~GHRR01027289.1.p1  ORF type:complete len:127 (-),score=32.91 GHRR01027289.1:632-1012(-)
MHTLKRECSSSPAGYRDTQEHNSPHDAVTCMSLVQAIAMNLFGGCLFEASQAAKPAKSRACTAAGAGWTVSTAHMQHNRVPAGIPAYAGCFVTHAMHQSQLFNCAACLHIKAQMANAQMIHWSVST